MLVLDSSRVVLVSISLVRVVVSTKEVRVIVELEGGGGGVVVELSRSVVD